MANDPLAYVRSGDALEIQAATANAWTDAARAARQRKHDEIGLAAPVDLGLPSLTVLVRNDTGEDLDPRSILRLTDWLISPVDDPLAAVARPVFKGATPAAATDLVVILGDAIPNGLLGVAIIAGVAVCDVLVNDATHTCAQPIAADNTQLESAATGRIKILKWETSGSTRRAIVLLGAEQFTVEEEDGTPVNGYLLKCPNNSLYDNGDGSVSLQLASTSYSGLINAISASNVQTLLGIKAISTTGGAWRVPWGTVGSCDLLSIGSGFGSTGSYAGLKGTDTVHGGTTEFTAGLANDLASFHIAARLTSTGDPVAVRYSIQDYNDGLTKSGAFGTIGPGAEIAGGIVVNAGSGSFFGASDVLGQLHTLGGAAADFSLGG